MSGTKQADSPQAVSGTYAALTGTVGYSECAAGNTSDPCPFYLGSMELELSAPLEIELSCDGSPYVFELEALTIRLAQPAFGIAQESSSARGFPPGSLVFEAKGVVDSIPFTSRRPNQGIMKVVASSGSLSMLGSYGARVDLAIPCGRRRDQARWWLGHRGCGVVGLLAVVWLGACGPSVKEAPEAQPWMLGVFSDRQPVRHSDTDEITQYHVYDDLELDMLYFNGGRPTGVYRRKWEPRGNDAFAMFPAEEESATTAISEYLVQPEEGASVDCGPYEVILVYGPQSSQPGSQARVETIHRGAVCAHPYDCTPPPEDPDACFGLHYTLEWCDEPPPPCEEPDG